MSIFKSERDTRNVVVLLDIGSSSVGAALAEVGGAEKPTIFFTTRAKIPFKEIPSFDRLTAGMVSALENALGDVQKNSKAYMEHFSSGGALGAVHVFYASPWFLSQTKKVTYTKEGEFVITEALLDELMHEEEKQFSKTELGKRTEESGRELKLLEHKVTDLSVNGYSVADPIGKKTDQLIFSLYMSTVPEQITTLIKKNVRATIGGHVMYHHTFTLSLYSAAREVLSSKNYFLLVDITGEVTDLALVRSGVLEGTGSFPIGKRTLIRKLGAEMKSSNDHARSLFKLHAEGMLEGEMAGIVTKALQGMSNEWITAFVQTAQKLSQDALIPADIIFTADVDARDYFTNLIQGAPLSRTPDAPLPKVLPFDGSVLQGRLSYKGNAGHDPFLSIEALYAHSTHYDAMGKKVHAKTAIS